VCVEVEVRIGHGDDPDGPFEVATVPVVGSLTLGMDEDSCAAGPECASTTPASIGFVSAVYENRYGVEYDSSRWVAPFLHIESGVALCEDCYANVLDGSLTWAAATGFVYAEVAG
jgi:hypothetical protein